MFENGEKCASQSPKQQLKTSHFQPMKQKSCWIFFSQSKKVNIYLII